MINSFLTYTFYQNNSTDILMDIHDVNIYDIMTIQVNLTGIAILIALGIKMLTLYIKSLKFDINAKVNTFRQYSMAFMIAIVAHIVPAIVYIVIEDKTNHVLDVMFTFAYLAPNWLLYMILKYNYISLLRDYKKNDKSYDFKLTK